MLTETIFPVTTDFVQQEQHQLQDLNNETNNSVTNNHNEVEIDNNEPSKIDANNIQTPWCEIFSNPTWICTVSCHFGKNWGYYLMLSILPEFFSDRYNANVSDLVTVTVIPYVIVQIISMSVGPLADYCIERSGEEVLYRERQERIDKQRRGY